MERFVNAQDGASSNSKGERNPTMTARALLDRLVADVDYMTRTGTFGPEQARLILPRLRAIQSELNNGHLHDTIQELQDDVADLKARLAQETEERKKAERKARQ